MPDREPTGDGVIPDGHVDVDWPEVVHTSPGRTFVVETSEADPVPYPEQSLDEVNETVRLVSRLWPKTSQGAR